MDSKITEFSSLSTRGYVTFISELSGIVEKGDWIAGALFNLKPFASVEDYYEKLSQFMDQLPTLAQVGIMRCYPQLISSTKSALSQESHEEHDMRFKNIDAPNTLTIQELNTQYVEKFEFPFISCVKENSIENILELMQSRIGMSYAEEVSNNIQQIKRIAWYRLIAKFPHKANL